MKKFMILALTLVSTSSFAQLNLDLRTVGSSFQLDFNNGYVCKSSPAFSQAPTLGYGQTLNLAQYNAINNCIAETGNARMHCEDLVCEAISFDNQKPSVSVSIENGQVGVRFSTGAKHSCAADAAFSGGVFIAEAPTRIEAQVYAERLCIEQTGNAQMHCRADSCGTIQQAIIGSDGVNLSDVFGRVKAERILNLEREIKVIEAKLANPHIDAKTKTKLTRELSKKTEKLIELKA